MSATINSGYTDTAISGVSSLSFPRGLLNFGSDFRRKETADKSTVLLTNITSPVDRPEQLRIAYSEIKDVFANSGIDSSVAAPSKKGVSLLCQLTSIASVTDSANPEYRVDLPISVHLVVKVPSNENITGATVATAVGRLVSGLFETGSTSNARIDSLLRGSLVPADL